MARERLYTDKIPLDELINKIALAEVLGKKERAAAFREILDPYKKEDTEGEIVKKRESLAKFLEDQGFVDGVVERA